MDPIRLARAWDACADSYWAAARQLPDADTRLDLPRLRLASLALEYRLLTFICAVRAGTPDGADLGRLLRLATLCGLELDAAEHAAIARLSRVHQGHTSTDGAPPMSSIAAVLERISAQSRARA